MVAITAKAARGPDTFLWPSRNPELVPADDLPSIREHLDPPEKVDQSWYFPDEEFQPVERKRRGDGAIILGFLRGYKENCTVLSPDGPIGAIRAQTEKVPGPGSVTGLIHDGRGVRNLSVAECLRIMGYPGDALDGVDEKLAYLIVGNSVARKLFSAILREALSKL